MQNNCAISSILPYEPSPEEWTARKVRHIYRRLGYGATPEQVNSGQAVSPSELIDELISTALNTPLPETPYWSDWTSEDYGDDPDGLSYEHYIGLARSWVKRSFDNPFQAKMSLFWHDHFATQKDVYGCNSSMWHYYKLLNQHAFGNFRTFVEEMGINRAMLVFLDGNENVAEEPNENYARELMELFTMGEGNGYTQVDIEEVARALTGWRMHGYECTPPFYNEDLHDDGVKTIFGQTGNFGYDDVHELIFTVRADQTAKYICTKLYQHLVYPEPNMAIVAEMVATFRANNWELVPVIKQLLKSEHFYDDTLIGSHIKHPLEVMVNTVSPILLDIDEDLEEGFLNYVFYKSEEMGMELFDPPNVAGWPGHRVWLSENALTYRWTFCGTILKSYLKDSGKEKLRQLALEITEESNDPEVIVAAMAEHWLSIPLEPDSLEVGVLFLKAGIPDNYFDDGSWNLSWGEAPDQLVNLLSYFIQIPEFQLA